MGQLVKNYGLLGNIPYVDRRAVTIVKTLFILCFSYTVNLPNFVT